VNLVSEIDLIALTRGSIADTFSQTFWVKGGERIEFTCQSKVMKFGMQLDDEDANKIITSLKKAKHIAKLYEELLKFYLL
jgi:hypothetical protein